MAPRLLAPLLLLKAAISDLPARLACLASVPLRHALFPAYNLKAKRWTRQSLRLWCAWTEDVFQVQELALKATARRSKQRTKALGTSLKAAGSVFPRCVA
jgi:hypothetical protein